MLEILRKFFHFCDERERREFYRSIALGVAAALFSALKIPAIGVLLGAMLTDGVSTEAILRSLAIMLVSVIGSSLLKSRATALQTDAGYRTAANKRVQIAEHLRYLPMGYFNANSLGAITSVTTNTMDNLSGASRAWGCGWPPTHGRAQRGTLWSVGAWRLRTFSRFGRTCTTYCGSTRRLSSGRKTVCRGRSQRTCARVSTPRRGCRS